MIDSTQIYKKPPLSWKELFAKLFVAIVATVFLGVEGYRFVASTAPVVEANTTATQPVVASIELSQPEPKSEPNITQPPIVTEPPVRTDITETFLQALIDQNSTAVLNMMAALRTQTVDLNRSAINVHEMIAKRNYKMVTLLIERDFIDVNATNAQGVTILHEAALKGHEGLIRLIISKGAHINAQTPAGVSALHYPVRLGYAITTQTLLDLGIDPNLTATLAYEGLYWRQSTPLHIAAMHGRVEMLKKLIAFGGDATLRDGDGLSVLDLALKYNHPETAAYIRTLEGFQAP